MNAFYVTVSIPLLLVLAGFNHAHGLTTFGKTQNQGTQQPQKTVQAQACKSQGDCKVKETTCLKNLCLCGNNEAPVNGKCKPNIKKGPNHICTGSDDCTGGAECYLAKDRNKTNYEDNQKICVCEEGLQEGPGGTCGGESNFLVLPGLVMIITSLSTILN